jgi:hypothetical protein
VAQILARKAKSRRSTVEDKFHHKDAKDTKTDILNRRKQSKQRERLGAGKTPLLVKSPLPLLSPVQNCVFVFFVSSW